jgi:hypothetical protein
VKALLLLLAAAWTPPAPAQRFDASLVVGYAGEGGLDPGAVGVRDLGIEGSFTWGASAAYFPWPRLGFEGAWTWQQTGIEISTAGGRARMFDVDVHRLHGSLVWQVLPAPSRIRPFLAVGAGADLFRAPQLAGEAKLSLSLAAGARYQVSRRLAARLQARYVPVHLADSGSEFCDPFGFCQDWLHQLEVTGGLVVGF